MKKLYILTLLFLSIHCVSLAQNLGISVYSEVSIFTCGPGDALFETFGHNAIRVKDPMLRMDIVFNYGTFDFRDPNFYTNFAEGRLEYWVSVSRYDDFENYYRSQKRWMKEQVLDLTHKEKQAFFDFLRNNALPQNRNYLYDPFYDNCSTKLRDITQEILNNEVVFGSDYTVESMSLRKIMNKELPWNTWGSFGINTALGSKLDATMTPEEYTYLPDYLYLSFKDAKRPVDGVLKNLVKSENSIVDAEERPLNIGLFSPLTVFIVLFLIVGFITYRDFKKQKRSRITDFTVFFISGLVGIFLIYLWFFTNHRTTPNNFNVLWAFAPNLVIGLLMFKKKLSKWMIHYSRFCLLLLLILFVIWITEVQLFNLAVLPLIGILILRYGLLGFLLSSKV